jgi:hypothetical protein
MPDLLDTLKKAEPAPGPEWYTCVQIAKAMGCEIQTAGTLGRKKVATGEWEVRKWKASTGKWTSYYRLKP